MSAGTSPADTCPAFPFERTLARVNNQPGKILDIAGSPSLSIDRLAG